MKLAVTDIDISPSVVSNQNTWRSSCSAKFQKRACHGLHHSMCLCELHGTSYQMSAFISCFQVHHKSFVCQRSLILETSTWYLQMPPFASSIGFSLHSFFFFVFGRIIAHNLEWSAERHQEVNFVIFVLNNHPWRHVLFVTNQPWLHTLHFLLVRRPRQWWVYCKFRIFRMHFIIVYFACGSFRTKIECVLKGQSKSENPGSGLRLYENFIFTEGRRSPTYENLVHTKYSGF